MLFFDFLLLRSKKDTIFNGTKVQEEVYYVELKISTIKVITVLLQGYSNLQHVSQRQHFFTIFFVDS